MVSVPAGSESRHPGPAVPRSSKRLPWKQVAQQRRHCSDAISEGRHQRDAAVRRIVFFKVLMPAEPAAVGAAKICAFK